MKRLEHWRTAFYEAIETHRAPFQWGVHDCAILTADCVQAVTGIDLAAPYRGRYASKAEAEAALAEVGHKSSIDILAAAFAEIPPSQAVVGDIAVIRSPLGPATAPIAGAELVVYGLGTQTIGLVPLSDAVRAFRVEIRET